MKYLITGANGFVGRALCTQLVRHGNVLGAVRTIHTGLNARQIAVMSVDESTDWNAALRNVGVVIHLAARAHIMNEAAADPLAEYRKVNVAGTRNLALQAAKAGVKRFVLVSSVKVNGEESRAGRPFIEGDLAAPEDDYGVSKHEAELVLRQIAGETGMECVIVRPPLVYGPGVKANFLTLIRAVVRGTPLPLAAVNNLRSLVGLDNLVDFLVRCATAPGAAGHTFFVSDGQDLSTPELIRRLAQVAGIEPRLFPVPVGMLLAGAKLLGRGPSIRRLCGNLQVNISLARETLAWTPPFTVDEGLRKTLAGIDAR
jgi:nucleoside-diphosphate-sugar epimerase